MGDDVFHPLAILIGARASISATKQMTSILADSDRGRHTAVNQYSLLG